jgi:hypothetical protein
MQTFSTFSLVLVCLWLIVTPRYHTGIAITAGLGLLACGILASLDEAAFGDRAVRLQWWGLFAVLWGLAWRLALRPWWLALSMRWAKVHAFARFWGLERRNARRSE